jgi:hypothetical protein
MRRCDGCGVNLTGRLEKCPLCHARLSGDFEPSVFPLNETKKSGSLALMVLAFVTGFCLLLMLLLWQLVPLQGGIVFAVCAALVANYLFIRNILTHRPDFLRIIVRYFLVLLAIAIVWFLLTGSLVVTSFVIPGICLLAIVFDAILLAVFRSTFVIGYAKYLLFDIVLGFAPLILAAFGLATWRVLAYISAFTASVLFLGLLAFMRRHLMDEIRKLFSL